MGWILVTAGVIQAADILVAVQKGDKVGWMGPLLGAGVHLWGASRVWGI